ncbi:MAG: hypothetical protein HQL32_08995 [Planctomycetes bacterium]|nr:hypothetical protein [Planctomycetota bacterium]
MSWQLKIGDPSLEAWVIVALYFISAFACLGAYFKERKCPKLPKNSSFWFIVIFFLLFLGCNKQLDLQTAFTDFLRQVAKAEGWYEARKSMQSIFIICMLVIAAISIALSLFIIRKSFFRLLPICLGISLLLTFILIRAASFHHMDHFLRTSQLGVPLHMVLEVTGILTIILGAGAHLFIEFERQLTEARDATGTANSKEQVPAPSTPILINSLDDTFSTNQNDDPQSTPAQSIIATHPKNKAVKVAEITHKKSEPASIKRNKTKANPAFRSFKCAHNIWKCTSSKNRI